MKIGYVIASNEVMKDGKPIGYFYREEPDGEMDSGWRFFSGEESQEYADDASNFAMYNASSIIEIDPDIALFLSEIQPVAYERDSISGEFIQEEE